MASIEDLEVGKTFFGLFKGAPGTGKSIAAHSFHKLGDCYTFDFDKKMIAIAARYRKEKINFQYDQFDTVFKALDKLDQLANKHCPYGVVIWDGWHTFASLALQTVLETRAPNKKRIGSGNIERYQIEDYGSEGRAIEQATNDLQKLSRNKGVHVVSIAHWRRVVSHNIMTGRDEIAEGLFIPGGKMAFSVPVPYDELYWFSVQTDMQGNSGQFMCETTGAHETKTILNIPKEINWTNKNLCEIIMGEHQKEMNVVTF